MGCLGGTSTDSKDHGETTGSIASIPVAFNVFMNVPVDGKTGKLEVLPPTSKPGDFIRLRAQRDLVIGLTACSAYASNGGSFKPIDYEIE